MQEAADGNRTTAWVKEGLAAGGKRPKSGERDGQEETEKHGERDRQTAEKQRNRGRRKQRERQEDRGEGGPRQKREKLFKQGLSDRTDGVKGNRAFKREGNHRLNLEDWLSLKSTPPAPPPTPGFSVILAKCILPVFWLHPGRNAKMPVPILTAPPQPWSLLFPGGWEGGRLG